MKTILYFLGTWIVGIFVLKTWVFPMFLEFVSNQNAVAILGVCIIVVYTIVCAIIVPGGHHEG